MPGLAVCLTPIECKSCSLTHKKVSNIMSRNGKLVSLSLLQKLECSVEKTNCHFDRSVPKGREVEKSGLAALLHADFSTRLRLARNDVAECFLQSNIMSKNSEFVSFRSFKS
jgi:hypothetical protein